MRWIGEVFSSPETRALLGLYLITLFGTLVMHVFQMNKGFKGSVDFLSEVLPGKSTVFYKRADLILVTVTGSVLGMIIFSPQSAISALAAGCGWVGGLNALIATAPPVRPGQAPSRNAEES
jgi:hypothetical protein